MRVLSLWWIVLLVVAASCAADAAYLPAEMAANGFVAGDELASEAAPTHDAEVSANASRWRRSTGDPAANPLAGAFFSDGESGDLRASTDSVFFDSDGDGLPDQSAQPANQPRVQRMLIYRGNLAVEVPRAEDAAKAFLADVEAWGGYLHSQTGTRLSVRLPAERFDAAFAAAKGAGRVLHEQRSASDVTEEFVDLGIRLDNARQSRQRLIELLAKADKVEDMLKIETELRRLTEEIERMEGRAKFLRDQVAMATLDIEFRSVAEAPPPPPHRRQPSRFSWINLVGASNLMERF